MYDVIELLNNPYASNKSENYVLTHEQIVKDISNEHLVHTNNIMLGVSVFCAVMAIFTFGIALLGILAAFLYKRHWDKKKQKAINKEYVIKPLVCTDKGNDKTYETSSVKYSVHFEDNQIFHFRDNSALYKAINVGEQCYTIHIDGVRNIAFAYNANIWTIGDDIKDKVEYPSASADNNTTI